MSLKGAVNKEIIADAELFLNMSKQYKESDPPVEIEYDKETERYHIKSGNDIRETVTEEQVLKYAKYQKAFIKADAELKKMIDLAEADKTPAKTRIPMNLINDAIEKTRTAIQTLQESILLMAEGPLKKQMEIQLENLKKEYLNIAPYYIAEREFNKNDATTMARRNQGYREFTYVNEFDNSDKITLYASGTDLGRKRAYRQAPGNIKFNDLPEVTSKKLNTEGTQNHKIFVDITGKKYAIDPHPKGGAKEIIDVDEALKVAPKLKIMAVDTLSAQQNRFNIKLESNQADIMQLAKLYLSDLSKMKLDPNLKFDDKSILAFLNSPQMNKYQENKDKLNEFYSGPNNFKPVFLDAAAAKLLSTVLENANKALIQEQADTSNAATIAAAKAAKLKALQDYATALAGYIDKNEGGNVNSIFRANKYNADTPNINIAKGLTRVPIPKGIDLTDSESAEFINNNTEVSAAVKRRLGLVQKDIEAEEANNFARALQAFIKPNAPGFFNAQEKDEKGQLKPGAVTVPNFFDATKAEFLKVNPQLATCFIIAGDPNSGLKPNCADVLKSKPLDDELKNALADWQAAQKAEYDNFVKIIVGSEENYASEFFKAKKTDADGNPTGTPPTCHEFLDFAKANPKMIAPMLPYFVDGDVSKGLKPYLVGALNPGERPQTRLTELHTEWANKTRKENEDDIKRISERVETESKKDSTSDLITAYLQEKGMDILTMTKEDFEAVAFEFFESKIYKAPDKTGAYNQIMNKPTWGATAQWASLPPAQNTAYTAAAKRGATAAFEVAQKLAKEADEQAKKKEQEDALKRDLDDLEKMLNADYKKTNRSYFNTKIKQPNPVVNGSDFYNQMLAVPANTRNYSRYQQLFNKENPNAELLIAKRNEILDKLVADGWKKYQSERKVKSDYNPDMGDFGINAMFEQNTLTTAAPDPHPDKDKTILFATEQGDGLTPEIINDHFVNPATQDKSKQDFDAVLKSQNITFKSSSITLDKNKATITLEDRTDPAAIKYPTITVKRSSEFAPTKMTISKKATDEEFEKSFKAILVMSFQAAKGPVQPIILSSEKDDRRKSRVELFHEIKDQLKQLPEEQQKKIVIKDKEGNYLFEHPERTAEREKKENSSEKRAVI